MVGRGPLLERADAHAIPGSLDAQVDLDEVGLEAGAARLRLEALRLPAVL
jgi:hypothetical protein